MLPKLIVFDIDQTLTKSKQPIASDMAGLITDLCRVMKVALTSGGMLEQLLTQVVEHLSVQTDFQNLFILPTSGGALFTYQNDAWVAAYEERLTPAQEGRIVEAIKEAVAQTAVVDLAEPSYGARIEKRGAQVTFSALGQEAPLDQKTAWDPNGERRAALRDAIATRLPGFDVKQGGSTSIDITKQGVNKAYGIRKLAEHCGIAIDDMLYVGDALFPGGNDAVVKETGIKTTLVHGPEDTSMVIRRLLTEIE